MNTTVSREERFKKKFEEAYGEGKWTEFCQLVKQETRPSVIQSKFVSKKRGLVMSKSTYYMWEARALEVSA